MNTSMVDALEAISAWFAEEMEPMLRAIEVEDDCEIARLKSVATFDLKDRQYPALEILPDATANLYAAENEPLDHEHWDVHTVFLYFTMAGQDSRDVQYTLLRYAEAVDRIVTDDNTAGGAFNRVRVAAAASVTLACQLLPPSPVSYTAPTVVASSAVPLPRAVIRYGSPGSLVSRSRRLQF